MSERNHLQQLHDALQDSPVPPAQQLVSPHDILEVQHADLVRRLLKPGWKVRDEMHPHGAHLLHMHLGMSTEVGELGDAIKKYAIYGKQLDMVNVIEELGDLEFYMEGLRRALGITREETLALNIEKLTQRYGKEYSNEAAIARADKEDEPRISGYEKSRGPDEF